MCHGDKHKITQMLHGFCHSLTNTGIKVHEVFQPVDTLLEDFPLPWSDRIALKLLLHIVLDLEEASVKAGR